MTTPNEEATTLKREADQLLLDTDLLAVLTKHGTPTFTGSYFYNLMTWRDIDICLPVTGQPMLIAADIVPQISANDKLASIYIRNEHVLLTEGNPKAVFVCMEFLPYLASLCLKSARSLKRYKNHVDIIEYIAYSVFQRHTERRTT